VQHLLQSAVTSTTEKKRGRPKGSKDKPCKKRSSKHPHGEIEQLQEMEAHEQPQHMASAPQTEGDTASEFVLSDGRTLSYSVYDDQSSSNVSFYFHGFPSSRLEASLLNSVTTRHSVKLIAPDRPGMDRSTFQLNRTILDWTKDVLELPHKVLPL